MDIVNAAVDAVDRRIDWVHIPVPIERDDDACFAPLGGGRGPGALSQTAPEPSAVSQT